MHRSKEKSDPEKKKWYVWKNKHDHERWLEQAKIATEMQGLFRAKNTKMVVVKEINYDDAEYKALMAYCVAKRDLEKKSKSKNEDAGFKNETPDLEFLEVILADVDDLEADKMTEEAFEDFYDKSAVFMTQTSKYSEPETQEVKQERLKI